MTVNVTNTVGANNTIVLDGSSKIPAFDGSLVTALSATAFTTGSLATARIDVGTTAGKILQLDGSARMPALSAVNLTNVPGPTVSTSDPAIDTNPTLGAKWINKTSGEVYICTDATTDENVWTNVGAGSGSVQPWLFQGSAFGYSLAGYRAGPVTNVIEKFSLTSDADATDVGDLLYAAQGVAGGKGPTHGYASGGETRLVHINKFSFSADGNAVDVADLTQGRTISSNSASSGTYCYQAGGYAYPVGSRYETTIDKFSVTADANATDVGDLVTGRNDGSTQTSATHGYASGGAAEPHAPLSRTDIIQRWAFASDGNAVDTTQNLIFSVYKNSGSSSTTYGYSHAGHQASANVNHIMKFQFDTSNNATDVADLTQTTYAATGHSSTTHGYRSGGATSYINVIDKYPFATDSNATDVGDLVAGGEEVAGTHN